MNLGQAMGRIALSLDAQRRAERRAVKKHPERVVYKTRSGNFTTTQKGLLTAHESQSGKYWVNAWEPAQMLPEDEAALVAIEKQRRALWAKEQRLLAKAHARGAALTIEDGLAITREREGK